MQSEWCTMNDVADNLLSITKKKFKSSFYKAKFTREAGSLIRKERGLIKAPLLKKIL